MKKIFTLILGLALCGSAYAKPPEERLILLVGVTPEAKLQAEMMEARLGDSHRSVEVVSVDSDAGLEFQASDQATYLFRKIENEIVWQRSLQDLEPAWADFQAASYDVDEDKLLRWSKVVPESSSTPLRQYDLIEFYIGGRPGLGVQATIGGVVLDLTEERPGFYSGGYRVRSEDRVEAKLRVTAQDSEGTVETLELGQLALEGMQRPQVTALGQVGLRDWIIEGEGPPSTNVELAIAIRIGGFFGKRTKRRTVEAMTDADGKFQAVARLGTLSSSPRGTVTAKVLDPEGVEISGGEQEVQFRSQVRARRGLYGGWNNNLFFRRGFFPGRCF